MHDFQKLSQPRWDVHMNNKNQFSEFQNNSANLILAGVHNEHLLFRLLFRLSLT